MLRNTKLLTYFNCTLIQVNWKIEINFLEKFSIMLKKLKENHTMSKYVCIIKSLFNKKL